MIIIISNSKNRFWYIKIQLGSPTDLTIKLNLNILTVTYWSEWSTIHKGKRIE